jgi:hypothetical protein
MEICEAGLQSEAQSGERLLFSTGGQLELSKCLYYIMSYEFKPDGTSTLRKAEDMGTDLINLTTGTSDTTTDIEHRDCSEAHKTLELHPATVGCQRRQATELQLKSNQFTAGGLNISPVTHYKARASYWMM